MFLFCVSGWDSELSMYIRLVNRLSIGRMSLKILLKFTLSNLRHFLIHTSTSKFLKEIDKKVQVKQGQ